MKGTAKVKLSSSASSSTSSSRKDPADDQDNDNGQVSRVVDFVAFVLICSFEENSNFAP